MALQIDGLALSDAVAGGLQSPKISINIVQIAYFTDQTRYRSMKLTQQQLTYGKLRIQRFLVPSGLIKPDELIGQVNKN
jgi:hypothetical protein